MTPAFEAVHKLLKQLPGLGHRSAERIALSLLVEKKHQLDPLLKALKEAAETLQACEQCANISEGTHCSLCQDPRRLDHTLVVVERVPDLLAIERSGAFKGLYHVLGGKLSPLNNIHPEDLNIQKLEERLQTGNIRELILALPNDIEGEATCHYLQERLLHQFSTLTLSRIGFGIPTGTSLNYTDGGTLRSAIDARRRLLDAGL